ncbi:MAG: hypothetical protein M1815_001449 [Lichina confinis]|nr:MAG: hypothetical protein M1815_001449 [Lichina confinis]
MPSIHYFNQSAPFWDFVTRIEDEAFRQSFSQDKQPEKDEKPDEKDDEKSSEPNAEQRRSCGGASWQRGNCGGGYRRGGHCGGRRDWRGGHNRGPWGMNPFVQFLQSQLNVAKDDQLDAEQFSPPVDVFETQTAYHIHASLPGAKKEDVGLKWDESKSELTIAGVVYRHGDEEFLKTLAMSERKVGVFERKVRLGNERHTADVDAEGITAKLEDGVLRVELPRVEKDFVSVRKVDITE